MISASSPTADEVHHLAPNLAFWSAYDPKSRSELFSTCLLTSAGLVLVDPILLEKSALADLCSKNPVVGVVVTNANHWRAANWFAAKFAAPVFAQAGAGVDNTVPFAQVSAGDSILDSLQVIDLAGGAPGEMALFAPGNPSVVIVGDALIHFGPSGFALLPAKYCADQEQLRKSLRQILPLAPERICFAHGLPILKNATTRLEALLRDAN